MGDYIGIASDSNFVYPCWNDNRTGAQQVYVCKIPIDRSGSVPQLEGHISSDANWEWMVDLTGDVLVDSGVTVRVKPGARIAAASTDGDNLGIDDDLVELIVEGTIIIEADSTDGTKITTFQGMEWSPGSWYGLRVVGGGRVVQEAGFCIYDAVNGISIEDGALVDELREIEVIGAENAGVWCASSGVSLSEMTIRGVSQGYGIYLDACDIEVDSCEITDCETGIYAYLSSATVTRTAITGEGMNGVAVNQSDGELIFGEDTLVIEDCQILGYFSDAHVAAYVYSPAIIDGCTFRTGAAAGVDASSSYFIKAGFDAKVRLRNSDLLGWHEYGIGYYSYKSKSDLGVGNHADGGYNTIDAGENGGFRVKHVSGPTGDTLKAESNWWGTDSPNAFMFWGKIDFNPFLAAPPEGGKIAVSPSVRDAVIPRAMAVRQNFPNPFNPNTTIEFRLEVPGRVSLRVFNVLGQTVRVLADREFPAGLHQLVWDGADQHGQPLASGVYFYRIETADAVVTKKMVLLK